jgi:hypothetical protein
MNKHPNQPCGPGKGTIFPGPFSQLSKGKIDEKQLFKFFSSFFLFFFILFIYLFIYFFCRGPIQNKYSQTACLIGNENNFNESYGEHNVYSFYQD